MKTLLLLVGMQGAGKTTALNSFKHGIVLKPSTTRPRRFPTEDEYHFEPHWNPNDYAWSIQRGTSTYGMRNAELQRITHVGLTVFDPGNIQKARASSAYIDYDVITIGLDTIPTLAEQHARVNNEPSRRIAQVDFDVQKAVVENCDVVLHGDAQAIAAAVNEIAAILGGRGGVINGDSIRRLIAGGTLLKDADPNSIEPASYDLRISDTYWCQGKYHTITDQNPLTIPPYSFVLVQAQEEARIPRFLVGTFDIRVSLFFSGVILSNGPQVDPGYHGGLFCMLHNASGSEVGINRHDHFATLQFQTLTTNSSGYTDQYQNKKSFADFLAASDAKKPGGKIYEAVAAIAGELKSDFKDLRNLQWGIMGVVTAVLLGVVTAGQWHIDKTLSAAEKSVATMENSLKDALERANSTQKQLDEALAKAKPRGKP